MSSSSGYRQFHHMKNRNGSFFFLSTTVGTKIIYISNQIELWKKDTEENTALEFGWKRGNEYISNLYSTAN